MRRITVAQLKKKYPRSYSDLLLALDVRAYNEKALKLAGIRSTKVYTTRQKRYFWVETNLDSNPFGSVNNWDTSDESGFKDCYILTLYSSGVIDKTWTGSDFHTFQEERIEYEVCIQDRKATYGMYTGDLVCQTEELIKLFIHTLTSLIDIDTISVRIFNEDKKFIGALRKVGFEISGQEQACYIVTKCIVEKTEPAVALLH
jgi:hypothetical protein